MQESSPNLTAASPSYIGEQKLGEMFHFFFGSRVAVVRVRPLLTYVHKTQREIRTDLLVQFSTAKRPRNTDGRYNDDKEAIASKSPEGVC